MENTASKYSHFQAPPNHSKPVFISTFQVFYKQKKKGNSFAFSSIYCFFLSSSNPTIATATITAIPVPTITPVLSAAVGGCSVPVVVAGAAVTPKAVVPDEVQ